MLRLNREKQAAQQAFLGELSSLFQLRQQPDRQGRRGLEALDGKTRLLSFAGDYQKDEPALPFDAIREILLKNRARLGLASSYEQAFLTLQRRYVEALASLEPLKRQLRLTDTLIDRLVYALYGLTEEEIAIVEG